MKYTKINTAHAIWDFIVTQIFAIILFPSFTVNFLEFLPFSGLHNHLSEIITRLHTINNERSALNFECFPIVLFFVLYFYIILLESYELSGGNREAMAKN